MCEAQPRARYAGARPTSRPSSSKLSETTNISNTNLTKKGNHDK